MSTLVATVLDLDEVDDLMANTRQKGLYGIRLDTFLRDGNVAEDITAEYKHKMDKLQNVSGGFRQVLQGKHSEKYADVQVIFQTPKNGNPARLILVNKALRAAALAAKAANDSQE